MMKESKSHLRELARGFIDVEAAVDNDEDEESEDGSEGGFIDDTVSGTAEDAEGHIDDDIAHAHRSLYSLLTLDVFDDEPEPSEHLKRAAIEPSIRANKHRRVYQVDSQQGGTLHDFVDEAATGDVFIIRCKSGKEDLAASQLKAAHRLGLGNMTSKSTGTLADTGDITDVFTLPFLKGRLYIISDSRLTVQNACRHEQGSNFKLSYTFGEVIRIPSSEANKVVLIHNGLKIYQRIGVIGTWVKIRHHYLYKDDFGLVLRVNDGKGSFGAAPPSVEHLDVLVVPRLAFKNRDHEPLVRNYEELQIIDVPFHKRPTPGLIGYDDVYQRFGPKAIRLEAFDMFSLAGERFYQGFHVIRIERTHVDELAIPTAFDVLSFVEAGYRATEVINRSFLRVHDKVRILEGEHMSTIGRVYDIGKHYVTVYVFDGECRGTRVNLTFEQLERVFGVNDWVKIMWGKHRGQVGVVTSTSEEDLTIAGNSGNEGCDVPMPHHLVVLTVPQSCVQTFDVAVPMQVVKDRFTEKGIIIKLQPVYVVSGPLKGAADLKYLTAAEVMVFCPDGRGFQTTTPQNVILSCVDTLEQSRICCGLIRMANRTSWRFGTGDEVDAILLQRAKERIAKYEADRPQSRSICSSPSLDSRINNPVFVMRGSLKGNMCDLLAVGNNICTVFIDVKAEHVQRVLKKDVISAVNWKYLDGRIVESGMMPTLMSRLARYKGRELTLNAREDTPPLVEREVEGSCNVLLCGDQEDGKGSGATWVSHPLIKSLMTRYHVCFRLSDTFIVPSDRGKMAWSLSEGAVTKKSVAGRQVEMHGVPIRYKPRSGDTPREMIVDVRHLKECAPLLRCEAVRIRGDNAVIGQVVFVQSWPEVGDEEKDSVDSFVTDPVTRQKISFKKSKPKKGKTVRVRPSSSNARTAKYFVLPVGEVTMIKPYGTL